MDRVPGMSWTVGVERLEQVGVLPHRGYLPDLFETMYFFQQIGTQLFRITAYKIFN